MTFEGDIVTPDELQSAGDLIDEYMVLISKPDSGQLFNMTVQDFKEALSIQGSEGWKTATLSSFFLAYYNGVYPQFRKSGNRVAIRGTIKPSSTIAGGSTNTTEIFTLPEGFRPSLTLVQLCQGSGKNTWLLTVSTDGKVKFSRYGTSSLADCPASAWLPFYFEFYVD